MIEILKMTRAVETAPTAIVLTDLDGKLSMSIQASFIILDLGIVPR